MDRPLRALIVEDSVDDAELLVRRLRQAGYEPSYARVETAAEMRAALAAQTWDVVLADYRMPHFSGPAALALLKESGLDVPFIVVSGAIGEEAAAEVMRAGARDFVTKGHLARLVPAIERELREAEVRRQRRWAEEEVERLRGEQARRLEERAAQLATILGSIADTVLVVDPSGTVTMLNDAARALLGGADGGQPHTLADIRRTLHLRAPDGRPLPIDEMATARALRGEVVRRQEQVAIHPATGHPVFLLLSAAPLRADDGQIVGAVAVARDVTELAELDRLKDQFIVVAAHELKTPVSVMKGYAQALLRYAQNLPDEHRRMLEAIDRGAGRIGRIVNDLLDISRLETGGLELRGERVDLGQLAREVAAPMALTAPKHRILVNVAQPAVVQADRERLAQVLASLLDNAIRYSPAGGDVDVAVARQGGEAVVSVTDRGVGIPAEMQGRIFERFYRAHTDTPHDYGGMGVGLYVAREIVRRLGGRMWFASQVDRGSTFSFALPLRGENGAA